MDIYFSQYFGIDVALLESYGAIDISVASDIPLFIDPFLLFNSSKPEYQELHRGILRYLKYLRSKSMSGPLPDGVVKNRFRFKEVKQNWLGFTVLGNAGHALGQQFATALNDNLSSIFSNFGNEQVTKESHLEKIALISDGVGRDGISDFVTGGRGLAGLDLMARRWT